MPKVSDACKAKMSTSQKNTMAWRLNWILGREFYRARAATDPAALVSMAYWDGIAWSNYPEGFAFTDDNPALKAYRIQVEPGFKANTPGWNNSTCSLDLPSLACFAFWLASTSDAVRQTAVALMQQYGSEIDIPYLKASCPQEVTADPAYQIEVPPVPGPGTTTTEPPPKIDTPGDTTPPGPGQLPPPTGTTTPGTTTPTPGTGLDQVKADDTTTGKKVNWWLWGGIGAAVVGGAALIGLLRTPEYVSNPATETTTDWDQIKQILEGSSGRYIFCSIAHIDDPKGEWMRRFRSEAAENGLTTEIEDGLLYVVDPSRVRSSGKRNPSKQAKAGRKSVTVHNLIKDTEHVYEGITPEQAVIAAYAQSLGDWNTWDYASKYGHLVKRRGTTVFINDFAATEKA